MVPPTTVPPTTTTTAPLNGGAIFAANCVICHGENGEGGYGANLQLSSLTRRQIITTVTNGRGAMESFADLLTPAEIEAVAKFVKRLQIG
jgi:mono/diheme cytochrome c family protein